MKFSVLDGGGGPDGGASGGDGGGTGGGVPAGAGQYAGTSPAQGTPYLINDPLCDVKPNDFNVGAKFPRMAWAPDLYGVIALAEIGDAWKSGITIADPPTDKNDIMREIEILIGYARDERAAKLTEILDESVRLRGYFAHVLMLSPWGHGNALGLIEMATRVGQVMAFYYKLEFNRARPQQVLPALVPVIDSPWHASYPNAHALEGHLIARALAEAAPYARKPLLALADRIGRNREVAGVHYPSDTAAGADVARQAIKYLRACPTFVATVTAARRELGVSEPYDPEPAPDEGT
jgi:membrane-associated phospholipid phosphatase